MRGCELSFDCGHELNLMVKSLNDRGGGLFNESDVGTVWRGRVGCRKYEGSEEGKSKCLKRGMC